MMYVELQLSAQDITDMQRKRDPRGVDINASSSNTPPTSQTFTSVPGSSSSQFIPQRPRPHCNSKHSVSLSESTTHTVTCNDQFCPLHSSPGQAVALVCQHNRCSQQPSPVESPTPATAVKKVSPVVH